MAQSRPMKTATPRCVTEALAVSLLFAAADEDGEAAEAAANLQLPARLQLPAKRTPRLS